MQQSLKLKQSDRFSDEKVVKTSVKVDVFDILLNGAIAAITGSVVMLAKTFQSASDFIVDGLSYIGTKCSKRPPTEKHPFGFGRELYIWSLFATLIMFLFMTGLSFYFGLQQFINPEPIERVYFIFFILSVSLAANGYAFSLDFRRISQGKPFWKIRQALSESTFLETKITFISDLMGTLAAAFGLAAIILFEKTGHLWFDGLGAMVIGLLMAFSSVWLFKNVRDFIIGVSASEETKSLIKKAALEVDGVENVLDLKAVVIGSNRLLVNLEIHVRSGLMTEEIEKLIDKVKAGIKQMVPSAYHIQVELETPGLS